MQVLHIQYSVFSDLTALGQKELRCSVFRSEVHKRGIWGIKKCSFIEMSV